MARKVYVNVITRLVINMDDGIPVTDVINDMDYSFTSKTPGADIIDTEIEHHEVIDSK